MGQKEYTKTKIKRKNTKKKKIQSIQTTKKQTKQTNKTNKTNKQSDLTYDVTRSRQPMTNQQPFT